MKLYTEEQVEEMLMKARFHNSDDSEMYSNEYLIAQYKTIELPSDEEIQDESEKYYDNNAAKAHDYYFELGAKWIRDIILQGGNK